MSRRQGFISNLLTRINDPKDTKFAYRFAAVLILLEAALCRFIVLNVPYTEIDWIAYMQEVEGYQQGELDYVNLKGQTGPLVYPAGFVHLFSFLRTLTLGGRIDLAQWVFVGLYLVVQMVVMVLYIETRALPPWSLVLLCASRRLHSIFLLRLFNDCWAMAVAYIATLFLTQRKWMLAVVFYSLAVSIKMNVLLMAPGVLAVMIKETRPSTLLVSTLLGIALQVVLAIPFLTSYPVSYVSRAFELTRVFQHKWSVSWAFVGEHLFTSGRFALVLMCMHIRLLWTYAEKRWFTEEGGAWKALQSFFTRTTTTPSPGKKALTKESMLSIVFSSTIIGILCARTLHYQFYSWYYHMLPFLLFQSSLPLPLALVILFGIEVGFNVYPPKPLISAVLLVLHSTVVWGFFLGSSTIETEAGVTRTKGGRHMKLK